MVTLTPAFGRDFKSGKAAAENFAANLDWILNDMSSPFDGKPCNHGDMVAAGHTHVTLRFDGLRKAKVVKL